MTLRNSQNAPEPVGMYPHARQVGDLLFLSGIGPRKKGSKDIPVKLIQITELHIETA